MANATVYEFDIYTAFNQLIMNYMDVSCTFFTCLASWYLTLLILVVRAVAEVTLVRLDKNGRLTNAAVLY